MTFMVARARPSPAGDLEQCLALARRGRRARRELLMEDSAHEADLTGALLDAVALFEHLHIRFALVGGLAAMYYGRARYTEEVDFITAGDHEAVLREHAHIMREHRFDPSCTWKLYHDSGIQIDLWKDRFVDDMVARAATATLAGRDVPIVDAHDLVAMKLRAQRPQDDYDISEIIKRTPLDDQTVAQRVAADEFDHYTQLKRRSVR
jgi:hypothetical protein